MSSKYEMIREAGAYIRERAQMEPKVVLVLGSGLGDYASAMEYCVTVDYGDIPGFPRSTAPGHAGKLHVGMMHGVPAAMMQGRFHYYEGHSVEDVVFPIRALHAAGAKTLLLTNASGGINTAYPAILC